MVRRWTEILGYLESSLAEDLLKAHEVEMVPGWAEEKDQFEVDLVEYALAIGKVEMAEVQSQQ